MVEIQSPDQSNLLSLAQRPSFQNILWKSIPQFEKLLIDKHLDKNITYY